jgi:hypothetical protein
MPHGTEHHLEEAEHAEHHSHDRFNRNVAMTMVVIAAVLAGVKVLGHRAHNDTLRYQIEANVHHTQADTLHTRASDQWSYYQAKKQRQYLYEAQGDALAVTAKDTSPSAPAQAGTLVTGWKARAKRYSQEAEEIKGKADKLEKEAEEHQEEAQHLEKESTHAHHRSDRYDLGEMGVELALVLCSVAILTKRPSFWYSGMGLGLLGLVVALSGLFLH